MNCLKQIDAQGVGSICIDSNSYASITDVFKMNNLISNINNILSCKRTFVGKLSMDDSKNIVIKFCITGNHLIGIASCNGEKAYQMLPIENCETEDFAWCYIDLLTLLANNIRCKIALS